MHGCRIESGMTSVIAGLTRNPCTDDQRIAGAAWIAGQARNDNLSVMPDSIRHPCSARTNATRKGVHGRTAPRNQGMSPGLAVWAAPRDVGGAVRRIASCVRELTCESWLNAATKERSEFSRRAAGTGSPGCPMAPKGAEGRHDREGQSAHVRLCREACTSERRCSAGEKVVSEEWIAGLARNDNRQCPAASSRSMPEITRSSAVSNCVSYELPCICGSTALTQGNMPGCFLMIDVARLR